MRREDMYFTSQSAKRAFLALMILIVFSSLLNIVVGVLSCPYDSGTIYFCDRSHYIDFDKADADCDTECTQSDDETITLQEPGGIYCQAENPEMGYINYCYADFNFETNYAAIDTEQLASFVTR